MMDFNQTVACPVPAHTSVRMALDAKRQYVLHPDEPPAGVPQVVARTITPIHAPLVYGCVLTAHTFWRRYQREMLTLLYYDFAFGTWLPVVPEQECGAEGVWCSLTAERNRWGVPVTWRLAGSIRSMAIEEDPAELARHVPAFDGLHIFLDLQVKQGMLFWPIYRIQGESFVMDLDDVMSEAGDGWLAHLQHQLKISDGSPEAAPPSEQSNDSSTES